MKKSKLSKLDQKAIIEAHNRTTNGIKLGPLSDQKKSKGDLPLFEDKTQTDLFK